MITTVTTTTTSTLMGATSLALVAIGTLVILLINRELILAGQKEWGVRLSRALNVGIVPLMLVFAMTVIMKFATALR